LLKRIIEIGVVVKSLTASGDRLHESLGAKGGTVLNAQEYGMVAQKHLPFISTMVTRDKIHFENIFPGTFLTTDEFLQ